MLLTTLEFTLLSPEIAQVTLNRPTQHNAYNAAMVAELAQVVDHCEQQPALRVVILTGKGEKSFCAGADLNEALVNGGDTLRNRHGGFSPLQYLTRRKIWIAALNGTAAGGGLELALQCEMIVAAEGCQLMLPEVRHNLLPAGGGIERLMTRLPPAIAREMLLTGLPISATRAQVLGLINRVVSAENVAREALALAEQVAANAPLAVQACNALANIALDGDRSSLQQQQEQALMQLAQSEDAQESQQAWQQRRKPQWRGR
ncbi:enoyl-CoA hydratase/isomerase family protein [Pantoea sp. A4]|uniref:enoyl-CoA hydratase/isomerase family protein n=1 Tax=Pantoea sp. A4 TaxID=1225184 RepID=UPI00037885EB|nr:enoyl-CoA hydratase-related protein [Pantoea sp. A4]